MVSGTRQRFEGLQELRLLAAAAVLAFHSGHFVALHVPAEDAFVRFWTSPIFSLGVNLFFGISGFVLMHALARCPVPRFLALRFLRIYPPFLAAVGLVFLAQWWFLGTFTPVPWASLTLLPLGSMNYPLLVQWSLVYEVFYYVVAAAAALVPRRSIVRWTMWLWAAAIVAGALLGLKSVFFPTFASIGLSLFNLCFIGGVLAYEYRAAWARRRWILLVAAIVGIAGIHPIDASVRQYLLMPFATTGLVSLMASGTERSPRSKWRALLSLGGDWSYGLYLLHVPIITLLLDLGLDARAESHPRAIFLVVAATALVFGSAYGWIELAIYRRARRVVLSAGRGDSRSAPRRAGA
jgi:peptidoglycan/LPS O-acetylase OafA/YrhL